MTPESSAALLAEAQRCAELLQRDAPLQQLGPVAALYLDSAECLERLAAALQASEHFKRIDHAQIVRQQELLMGAERWSRTFKAERDAARAALRAARAERDASVVNRAASEGSPEARANQADYDRMVAEHELALTRARIADLEEVLRPFAEAAAHPRGVASSSYENYMLSAAIKAACDRAAALASPPKEGT